MGTISRNQRIVNSMEALALDLLKRAEGPKVAIDVQMDVFDRIGKWIAIKNKLENDDGGGIAEYKRALAGEAHKHPTARRSRGRPDQPTGGAALAALKSRIPSADDGGSSGDSGGSGSEDTAAA